MTRGIKALLSRYVPFWSLDIQKILGLDHAPDKLEMAAGVWAIFNARISSAQKAFGAQKGWCCQRLKLRKGTRESCLSQKGDFHVEKKTAEQQLKVALAAEKSSKGSASASKNKFKKAPTIAPM